MTLLNKLQKIDKDTNDLIDLTQKYLFSIGIRASKERAWDILQTVHKLPFEYIISKNKSITYQGQGAHISSKHGNQHMVIKNLGKFEVKAVVNNKANTKKAVVKFTPSADIAQLVADKVEVL